MIPPELTPVILQALHDAGEKTPITRVEKMRWGRVSSSWRIVTGRRSYLLKYHTNPRPFLFSYEQYGLDALSAAGANTPTVLVAADSRDGSPGYCLQEWVYPGSAHQFVRRLGAEMGRLLATVHRHGIETNRFGCGFHAKEGPVERWYANWAECLVDQRMRPRVMGMHPAGLLTDERRRGMERLMDRIPALIGDRQIAPALLHGDLHAQNVLCNREGEPVLIDPCVHWGDREGEIAYTTLWGGFSPGFYRAYNEEWPLDDGYKERRDLALLCDLLDVMAGGGAKNGIRIDATITRYVGYAGLT
jgi:fructosamine-3-kinase